MFILKTILQTFIIIIFLFGLHNVTSFALDGEVSTGINETNRLKELYKTDKYFWVVYDNICPYCRSATQHIKQLDWEGRFKFLSYRDPLTYKIFPNLRMEECEKDIHMVTPKGEVLMGYEVFRTIIDNLTATKVLNPLLKNDYAEKKLNEIYERMVKERSCYYKKSDTCPLKKHGP